MRPIPRRKDENPWRAIALVSAIGVELAVCVLLGVWIGRWLDGRMNTDPLFLLIGIFVGMAIGIWAVIQLIKPFTEEENDG